MQELLTIDGCYGIYTFAENESASTAICNDLIIEAQSAGVLNLDLRVPVTRLNTERAIIEAAGFAQAGTHQTNENQRAVTYVVFRRCARSTGDGNNMAVAFPVLAPSPLETASVELMKQRMSAPIDEARLAAMGKQPDAPKVADPVIEKMRKEIAELEAQS